MAQHRPARQGGGGIPYVSYSLIALNVISFALCELVIGHSRALALGGLSVASLAEGMWWTPVTSMFMHGDIIHLGNNMVSLAWLCQACESRYGRGRALALYMVGGLAGGLAYVAVRSALGDMTPAVGASGAIFGLFGAYGSTLMGMRREGVDVGAALSSWVRMLLLNLVVGITSAGIANEAHVGGLVAGFLFDMLLGGRDARNS